MSEDSSFWGILAIECLFLFACAAILATIHEIACWIWRKATGGMRDDEQPEDEMSADVEDVNWDDSDNWRDAMTYMVAAYEALLIRRDKGSHVVREVCSMISLPYYSNMDLRALFERLQGIIDERNRLVDENRRLVAEYRALSEQNESLRRANAELSAHLGILPGETG